MEREESEKGARMQRGWNEALAAGEALAALCSARRAEVEYCFAVDCVGGWLCGWGALWVVRWPDWVWRVFTHLRRVQLLPNSYTYNTDSVLITVANLPLRRRRCRCHCHCARSQQNHPSSLRRPHG